MLDTQFEIDRVSIFTSMGPQLKKNKKNWTEPNGEQELSILTWLWAMLNKEIFNQVLNWYGLYLIIPGGKSFYL